MIALTGCLASRFCQRIVEDRPGEARAHARRAGAASSGPSNVYFEVQNNGIAEQDKANEGIVRIAREIGRPLVGTADVHYLRREDYHHHAALLCVQTKSTLAEPKMTLRHQRVLPEDPTRRWRRRSRSGPRRSPTTLEIAERCDVEIELGKQLIPRFPTPNGEDESAYLRELRRRRAARALRRPAAGRGASSALEMELGVIDEHGLRGLLPDRVGLRQVRQGQRHRRRPRPRLGGRLDRRLLPARSPTSTRCATTCCSSAS